MNKFIFLTFPRSLSSDPPTDDLEKSVREKVKLECDKNRPVPPGIAMVTGQRMNDVSTGSHDGHRKAFWTDVVKSLGNILVITQPNNIIYTCDKFHNYCMF